MIDMKWFGRSKNKEKEGNDSKTCPAKLKKDDETITEKTTTKPSTQKIETENTDSISNKLQLVKEEYNEVVGNLMHAKREQKSMMEKIQQSNNEYNGLKDGIKLLREDLLKVNNELREKNEKIG